MLISRVFIPPISPPYTILATFRDNSQLGGAFGCISGAVIESHVSTCILTQHQCVRLVVSPLLVPASSVTICPAAILASVVTRSLQTPLSVLGSVLQVGPPQPSNDPASSSSSPTRPRIYILSLVSVVSNVPAISQLLHVQDIRPPAWQGLAYVTQQQLF